MKRVVMSSDSKVQPSKQVVNSVPFEKFFLYVKHLKGLSPEFSEIEEKDFTSEKIQTMLKDESLKYLQDVSLKSAAKFVLSQLVARKHREALAHERMVILGACEQWSSNPESIKAGRPYERIHVTLARPNESVFDTGEYWRDDVLKNLSEDNPNFNPNLHEATIVGEIATETSEKFGEQRHFNIDSFEDLMPVKDIYAFLNGHAMDIEDIYEEDAFYKTKGTILVKGKIFEFRPLPIMTKKFEETSGKTKPPVNKTVNVLPFLNGRKFAAQVNVDLGQFSGRNYSLKVYIYPGQFSNPVIYLGQDQEKIIGQLASIIQEANIPVNAAYDDKWTDTKDMNNKSTYQYLSYSLVGQGKFLTSHFKGVECFFAGRLTRKLVSEEDRKPKEGEEDSNKRWLEMDATLMYLAKPADAEEEVDLSITEEVHLSNTAPAPKSKIQEVIQSPEAKTDAFLDAFLDAVDNLKPIVFDIIKFKEKITEEQIKSALPIQGFKNVDENVLNEVLTQLLQEAKIFEPYVGVYHVTPSEEKTTKTVSTPAPAPAPAPAETLSTALFEFLTDLHKAGPKGLTKRGFNKKIIGLGATQAGFDLFTGFVEKSGLMISPKENQYKLLIDSSKAPKLIPLLEPILTGILQEKMSEEEAIKQWVSIISTPAPVPQVVVSAPINARIDAAITEAMKMFKAVETFYDPAAEQKTVVLKALASNFKNNVNLKPVIKQTGAYTDAEVLQVYNQIMAEKK